MIIKGTGNVGIGTGTNPSDPLVVQGNITAEVDGGPSSGPSINLKNSGGFGIGSLDFYTYANQTVPTARWQAADLGGFTADQVFYTNIGGSANQPLVERMRIKGSTGNVGIGTGAPGAKLEVNGNAQVDGNLTVSGSILSASSGLPVIQAPINGSYNFSAGIGALQSSFGGSQDTAVGDNTLSANTTGGLNTAIGNYALYNNTTGLENTAVGVSALQNNTTGQLNTAVGVGALMRNTTA